MIFASEEQKVRLAKMNADIRYTNAETAKILTNNKADSVVITPEITEKLASRWNQLAATGATVDTSAEMENILGKYAKAGKEADFYDAIAKQASDSAKAQAESKKEKAGKSKEGESEMEIVIDDKGNLSLVPNKQKTKESITKKYFSK
jgi:hypothetical protein